MSGESGESGDGTGVEVVAETIHRARASKGTAAARGKKRPKEAAMDLRFMKAASEVLS